MNALQVQIICICRGKQPKSVKEVYRKLIEERKIRRQKGWICNVCSELEMNGYLRKGEINHRRQVGRSTYYTSTPEGIVAAIEWIEKEGERRKIASERDNSSNIATLRRYMLKVPQ